MTVTNICFLKLASGGELPSEFLDQIDQMLDSQDKFVDAWYTKNTSETTRLSDHRGLVTFEQIEDPRGFLGSSTFPTKEAFEEWFNTEGRDIFHSWEPHHSRDEMEIALLDGYVFPDEKSDDGPILTEAPSLEITRWRIAPDYQEQFISAVKALERQKKEDHPDLPLFSSWRVDNWLRLPELDGIKEYCMITSCDEAGLSEISSGSERAVTRLTSKEEAACDELSVSVTKKHYKRGL